jgi:hypothetical protein
MGCLGAWLILGLDWNHSSLELVLSELELELSESLEEELELEELELEELESELSLVLLRLLRA